jgi:hypothetical protein
MGFSLAIVTIIIAGGGTIFFKSVGTNLPCYSNWWFWLMKVIPTGLSTPAQRQEVMLLDRK